MDRTTYNAFMDRGWYDATPEGSEETHLIGIFGNFDMRLAIKFVAGDDGGWYINRDGGPWRWFRTEDLFNVAMDAVAFWGSLDTMFHDLANEWYAGRLVEPTPDQCDVLAAFVNESLAENPTNDMLLRELEALQCARAGWKRNFGRLAGGPMFVSPNCDGQYYCVQLGRTVNGVRELFLNPAGGAIFAANVFGFSLEQILAYPVHCYDQCVKEAEEARNRK